MSKVRLVEIVDLIPEWSDRVRFSVIARDKGHTAKKAESNRIWKGRTSSEIAESIAKLYKLKFKIDTTSQVWFNMPQGNKSDFELLRQLAQKEPGYCFYISDDTLYFIKRKFDKKPISIYTYGDGSIISFKVKAKESQQDTASNDTTYVGIDPFTGKPNAATSDGIKDANLGKKGVKLYDSNGLLSGIKNVTDAVGANKVMPDPSGNNEEMKNNADALQQSSLDNALKASFESIGNPNLEVDELMTVNGIGKRYSGNWYLSEITDDITAGGSFKTTGELLKDGTAKSIKEDATDNPNKVNDTPGEDTKKKKEIPRYDENGKRLN